MKVEIVKENEDGSAEAVFEMTAEEHRFFAGLGILKALENMLEDEKYKNVILKKVDAEELGTEV
jgi:hypothetical protein